MWRDIKRSLQIKNPIDSKEKTMGIISKDQETGSSFQPFPAGKYSLEIKATEWKATKAGNGHYLNLEMVVIKGKQKGRMVWHTLNLDNPSKEAVNIAKNETATIINQIYGEGKDVESIKQLQKMITGKRVEAQIKIRKDDTYGDKNEISYFIDPNDTGSKSSGSDDDTSAGSSSTPPWETEGEGEKTEAKSKKSKKDKKDKKKKKKGKKDKAAE